MTISLISILSEGGCYWQRDGDSPGHSFAIPNGTPFKIALEGPASSRFIDGVCRDGYFVTHGKKFMSAHAAVNAVREPSSNAFLYIRFLIGRRWTVADELRHMTDQRCDEAEEEAIDLAIKNTREKSKKLGTVMNDMQLLKAAAELIISKPAYLEIARRRLQMIAELSGEI